MTPKTDFNFKMFRTIYKPGVRVHHTMFGPGTVTRLNSNPNSDTVWVLFHESKDVHGSEADESRTFEWPVPSNELKIPGSIRLNPMSRNPLPRCPACSEPMRSLRVSWYRRWRDVNAYGCFEADCTVLTLRTHGPFRKPPKGKG